MKKLAGSMLILFALAQLGFAQKTPIVRPAVMPQINVTNLANGEQPVRISEVKTDVTVVGTMAVTTVEMVFYNPNNRVLEGELQFPLGEGQTISRFALDIDGKLREGVVVDKAKGQEAFESVIRQRIDPGLLERTQGNNFRARVYPLPPRGTRRIAIAYEQELQKSADGYRFHLPVEYGNKLDNFELQLKVFSTFKQPEVNETPWSKFSFDKGTDAYVASYKVQNYEAKGQVVFSIPDNGSQKVFVEKGKISGEHYFFANVQPDLSKLKLDKVKPRTIAIFWDNSASMEKRDLAKEIEFLNHYFKTIENVNVILRPFNCKTGASRNFVISDGHWDSLKLALEAVQYDGGTQLGALDLGYGRSTIDQKPSADPPKVLKRIQSAYEPDEILLFSDGLSNFGNSEPVLGHKPVTVVNSLLSADHSMLKYISQTTGGKYINLMQQTPAQGATVANDSDFSFLYATYNDTEIAELTPSSSSPLAQGADFSIAGMLISESATITLNFGVRGKVLYTEAIQVKKSQVNDYNNIVERVWAEKMIGELDLRYEKNKERIESLGKQFNIVTRNTSLIVLDRVADYVRYQIVPPAELLTEYNRIMESQFENKDHVVYNNMESVVHMFDDYKSWWGRSFPKTCMPKAIRQKEDMMVEDHLDLSVAEVRIVEPVMEERVVQDVYMVVEREETRDMDMVSDRVNNELSDSETLRFVPPAVASDNKQISAQSESKRKDVVQAPVQQQPAKAKIELKPWNASAPYLKILNAKPDADLYRVYLDIKAGYSTAPSFYLEVAGLFEGRGMKEEALVVLSNLAELEVEDYRLMRVLAHRLNHLGYAEYAIEIFKRVEKLRPNEPQSYRDLALAYENNGEYQNAVDYFQKIIDKPWDRRFNSVEGIAVEELNHAISLAKQKNVQLDLSKIDKRLIGSMPIDVRVVLNWDTDNSDMDLWVTDPCGSDCGFSNTLTPIGGTITNDYRQGYGPEVFRLKKALNGKYKVKTNYYGSNQQTVLGPTTVYLELYTHYGTPQETKEYLIIKMDRGEGMIDIGAITFGSK